MVDFVEIFRTQPEKYDLLVSKEDYKNNLLKRILGISQVNQNSFVLDMGTGTGRISYLLSEHVKKIFAFDRVKEMVNYARKKLSAQKKNIEFDVSDNTNIPLDNDFVDLAVEGWAFLAMKLFSKEDPIELMKKAVSEMERVTKSSGHIIIIETQGTCVQSPTFEDLPQLKVLTDELGFSKEVLETDYKFDSIEQALDLIEFFFDKEGRSWVENNSTSIVKEYTGIWWKRNIK